MKNTATFGGITGIVFNLIDTIVPQGNGFDFSLMTEIGEICCCCCCCFHSLIPPLFAGVTIYVCCVTYVPVFQVLRARAKDNEMIDALGGGQVRRDLLLLCFFFPNNRLIRFSWNGFAPPCWICPKAAKCTRRLRTT